MVLTSGTLEPAGDFALIKSTTDEEESKDGDHWRFSCGHVVSQDNFQAMTIGHPFDFRYEQRGSPAQMAKLVNLIQDVAQI